LKKTYFGQRQFETTLTYEQQQPYAPFGVLFKPPHF